MQSLRKAVGLTQEDIAKALGVRVRAVQTWESGKHRPRLRPDQYHSLLALLECDSRQLASQFENTAAAQ